MGNRQIKSGIVLSYLYVFLNIISGIFFTPFLIKSLGQSQYGLYEIVASLASNLSLLNLGMGDSIVKYVAQFRVEKNVKKQGEIVGAIIKILSKISFIGGIFCLVLYFYFDTIYATSLTSDEIIQGKTMFIIVALNLMISLPGGTFGNILCAYEKFGLIRAIGIIKILGRVILITVFVCFMPSAMTILLIDTVLNIVLIVVEIYIVRKRLKIPVIWHIKDKSMYKDIFSFSAYVIFFMIAKEVQFQTDKTIIGMRMSTAWVTIYAAGSKMSATFNQLGHTLSSMYLPRAISIRNAYEKEAEMQYKKYMVSMGRILLPITSAVLIGFIGLGNAFMTLWVGEGYRQAYVSAAIMMIALFLPIIEDTGLAILKAEGKQRGIAIACFVSSIANIILTWLAIPSMGIVGASIMTLLTSYGINMVALNIILKKTIGLRIGTILFEIFKGYLPVLIGSGMFFTVYGFIGFGNDTWIKFIIEGCLFIILFGALVYIFYIDKNQKNAIKEKLKCMINRRTENNQRGMR